MAPLNFNLDSRDPYYSPIGSPSAIKNEFPGTIQQQPTKSLATSPMANTSSPQPPAINTQATGGIGVQAPKFQMSGGGQALQRQQAAGYSVPTTNSRGTNVGSALKTGAAVATDVIGSMTQANANMAATDYTQKMQEWKEQGKYWFDPNANLMPNIEAYMKEMPSSKDALLDSRMINFKNEGVQNTAQYMADPGTMSIKFLADATGNKELGQQIGYAAEKGNEGALKGFSSGGWVGAIVGGVAGLVEGFFGWAAADKQDKEERKKALAEYDRKMKEWIFNRNKRLKEQKDQYEAARQVSRKATREKKKAEAESANTKKANSVMLRRQQIVNALQSAGKTGQAARQQRIARWN